MAVGNAIFVHNWATSGQEITVDIPNFNNTFQCSNNCNWLKMSDYPAEANMGSFAQELMNAGSMSPETAPLDELHDRAQYWVDVLTLAGSWKQWALNNAQGAWACRNACINWRCWLCGRWNCHNQSRFCNWSSGTLYTEYLNWLAEVDVADTFYAQVQQLQIDTQQALDDETNFVLDMTQLDLMKANLQIAMANASDILGDIEFKQRMNKTKALFLPVMAILLIIVIAFLFLDTKKYGL